MLTGPRLQQFSGNCHLKFKSAASNVGLTPKVPSECLEIRKVTLKTCLWILVLRLFLRLLYRPPEGMPLHGVEKLLDLAMRELNLSVRAYHRILKVSRTIADLAGEKAILPEHIFPCSAARRAGRSGEGCIALSSPVSGA